MKFPKFTDRFRLHQPTGAIWQIHPNSPDDTETIVYMTIHSANWWSPKLGEMDLDELLAQTVPLPGEMLVMLFGPEKFPTQMHPISVCEVEKAVEDFCARYIGQGYYSGVGERIPLDVLPSMLTICPWEPEPTDDEMEAHRATRRE
jgi:hypothetical protein